MCVWRMKAPILYTHPHGVSRRISGYKKGLSGQSTARFRPRASRHLLPSILASLRAPEPIPSRLPVQEQQGSILPFVPGPADCVSPDTRLIDSVPAKNVEGEPLIGCQ